MITIIDYGMGNLRSVAKAFETITAGVAVSSKPEEILKAEKLVLPGVGAFSDAMDELKTRRLIQPIILHIESGKPFLGLCLGMQLLFQGSEEAGKKDGLCILKGESKRFKKGKLKVPHMGWNQVEFTDKGKGLGIFDEVKDKSHFYFVHSYYVVPEDKSIVIGRTSYGIDFTSAIQKDNIYAMQYHPEKSQTVGLKIVENFVRL